MPVVINGTTGIVNPDGSAATPSVAGTDTNTGVFFPAADTVAIATGGTEAMRVNSSQNVGIGTSSPNKRLHIQNGSSGASNYGVPGLAVESSSNVDLQMMGSTTGQLGITFSDSGNNQAGFIYYQNNGDYMQFATNGSERARIGSDGKFTLATETLYITNIPTTSTAGNCLISSGEGNKFYRSTSSIKYKRNVVDMQRGLADVQQLRPVNFNGVSDFDGDKLFAGFIAEEVEALGFKEFVIYDENGEPDGLQYANMVALLTKSIQELKAEVDALKAQLGAQP